MMLCDKNVLLKHVKNIWTPTDDLMMTIDTPKQNIDFIPSYVYYCKFGCKQNYQNNYMYYEGLIFSMHEKYKQDGRLTMTMLYL